MRLSLNFNFFPTPSYFFLASNVCVCVCDCVRISCTVLLFLLYFAFVFFFVIFFLFLKILFCFRTHAHSSKKVFQVFRNGEHLCPLLYCLVLSFHIHTLAAHCSHHEFQFLHSDSGLLQSIRPYNNYAIWTNPCYILLLNRLD